MRSKNVSRKKENAYLRVINVLHSCVFLHGGFLLDIHGDPLKSGKTTGEQLWRTETAEKQIFRCEKENDYISL